MTAPRGLRGLSARWITCLGLALTTATCRTPLTQIVVAVDTDLDPHALLTLGQALETRAHRVRVERWGPRTLDVDVLLYDDVRVDDDDLTVPHPRLWERGFVLAPLRDVAPALVEPTAAWEGVRMTALTLQVPRAG